MSVTFKGSEGWLGAMYNGAVIQTVAAQNYTTGSKVFASRSVYEEVPGLLRVAITPKFKNSIFIARVHLRWGGWASGTDVAPLFRVYWGTTAGVYTNPLGPLWMAGQLPDSKNLPSGVHTGTYNYGFGDSNHSALQDNILAIGSANDGTVNTKYFALQWACGYEASARTLYWNRCINTGNAYNPIHTCTMTVSEVLMKG